MLGGVRIQDNVNTFSSFVSGVEIYIISLENILASPTNVMGVSLYLLISPFSYLVVVKIAIGEKPKKEVNGQQYRFTLVGGEKKGRLCFCTLN